MNEPTPTSLPHEIADVLARLRGRIQRYVLLEGAALVVVLLGAMFWFSLGIDWAYFQLSHLELPRWFRLLFVVAAVSVTALAVVTWLLLRMIRRFHSRALALVLEKRFPELDDRLITAVEFSGQQGPQSPMTTRMVQRTMTDAVKLTEKMELGQVFNQRPLQQAVLLATVAVASIAGLAVADAGTMQRWYAGFIGLQSDYWNRETVLAIKVLAPNGDELREFRDNTYRHPRGADLTLVVETLEGKRVPERVRLDYRLKPTGGFGRVYLTESGERPFQHTLPDLLESLDIWITGGDFTNAVPYRVEVVDPPRIDRIELDTLYPAYTGLNEAGESGRSIVPVLGTQATLPVESDFILQAFVSKPLQGFRLELEFGADRVELVHGISDDHAAGDEPPRTTLRWRGDKSRPDVDIDVPPEVAASFLSGDGLSLQVPFILKPATGTVYDEILSPSTDEATSAWRIPYPADAAMKISLIDVGEIPSTEPTRFTLMGIADQPPEVTTELRGISNQITRKATIPIAGTILDDYGVAASGFEYRAGDEEQWQTLPFDEGSPSGDKVVTLGGEAATVRFAVLPLNLSLRQQLRLAVTATDGDDLNGPHTMRGQVYTFEVVSNEELLSNLYAKELNLRRRFTQIREELTSTRNDLQLHRDRIEAGEGVDVSLSAAIETAIERALHTVRKNATELESIHLSFQDIRDEMVNNAVDTPQLLDRIDGKILAPLRRISEFSLPRVDEQIGILKLTHEQHQDPREEFDRSLQVINEVLAEMERILLEMRKLETFQEALELLKAIIAEQEGLMEDVRVRRRREAIERLQLD